MFGRSPGPDQRPGCDRPLAAAERVATAECAAATDHLAEWGQCIPGDAFQQCRRPGACDYRRSDPSGDQRCPSAPIATVSDLSEEMKLTALTIYGSRLVVLGMSFGVGLPCLGQQASAQGDAKTSPVEYAVAGRLTWEPSKPDRAAVIVLLRNCLRREVDDSRCSRRRRRRPYSAWSWWKNCREGLRGRILRRQVVLSRPFLRIDEGHTLPERTGSLRMACRLKPPMLFGQYRIACTVGCLRILRVLRGAESPTGGSLVVGKWLLSQTPPFLPLSLDVSDTRVSGVRDLDLERAINFLHKHDDSHNGLDQYRWTALAGHCSRSLLYALCVNSRRGQAGDSPWPLPEVPGLDLSEIIEFIKLL